MTHYDVRPRYTPGSPAMLTDGEQAHRVAVQERKAYAHSIAGRYGEEARRRAEELGLLGIVEEVYEKGGRWHVLDLITGRRFVRGRIEARKIKTGDTITILPDGRRGEFTVLRISKDTPSALYLTVVSRPAFEAETLKVHPNDPITTEARA